MRNVHAVCFPFQAQSHIGPMLKLAMILHHRGFFVTFVNSEFTHRRMLRSGCLTSLEGLPGWRFVSIPDGLPPSDTDADQDLPALCDSSRTLMVGPFSDLIEKMLKESSDFSRISHIVADGLLNFVASPASEKFGIPLVHLFTIAACSLLALKYYRSFFEKCIKPFKGYEPDKIFGIGGSENTINWIPGMKNMRPCDMPCLFRAADEEDTFMSFIMDVLDRTDKANVTIIRTFEKLERNALDAISSLIPKTYTIGPFHFLLEKIHQEKSISEHIHGNLWEEHVECLQWLDSKEPGSVLYVNFGSAAFLTHGQLTEFAMGLANSECSFLWVLRPDLMNGETATLPPSFVDQTKERGFLSSWCPQEKVLKHKSVRGFLTHCGWNSLLESLGAVVPMICWPNFGDQQTNARYASTEWKVGLEACRGSVVRDKIEDIIRELFAGKKGKVMKKTAMEWKGLAEDAVSPSGSSIKNLEEVFGQALV
ncbi:hypothetical protein MLD38_037670 [Melastoma candidum]|uniref:Uncharacterized protein n=1 Tax=Melastoma candidum TaxID=119954 RepID=A0ACB9LMZ9_9MYRT|nr:hypothetical protein MLD38_037670 [Melastoma candidum]